MKAQIIRFWTLSILPGRRAVSWTIEAARRLRVVPARRHVAVVIRVPALARCAPGQLLPGAGVANLLRAEPAPATSGLPSGRGAARTPSRPASAGPVRKAWTPASTPRTPQGDRPPPPGPRQPAPTCHQRPPGPHARLAAVRPCPPARQLHAIHPQNRTHAPLTWQRRRQPAGRAWPAGTQDLRRASSQARGHA
jgi:hypothetical protein